MASSDGALEKKLPLPGGWEFKMTVSGTGFLTFLAWFISENKKQIDYMIVFLNDISLIEISFIILIILFCVQSWVLLMMIETKLPNILLTTLKTILLVVFVIGSAAILISQFDLVSKNRFSPLNIRLIVNRGSSPAFQDLESDIRSSIQKLNPESSVYLIHINDKIGLMKEISNAKKDLADIVLVNSIYFSQLLIDGDVKLEGGNSKTLFFTTSTVFPSSLKNNKNLISIAPSLLDDVAYIAKEIATFKPNRIILISDGNPISQKASKALMRLSPKLKVYSFLELKIDDINKFKNENNDYFVNFSKKDISAIFTENDTKILDFYSLSSVRNLSPLYDHGLFLNKFSMFRADNKQPIEIVLAYPIILEAAHDPYVGLGFVFLNDYLVRLKNYNINFNQLKQVNFFYNNIFERGGKSEI